MANRPIGFELHGGDPATTGQPPYGYPPMNRAPGFGTGYGAAYPPPENEIGPAYPPVVGASPEFAPHAAGYQAAPIPYRPELGYRQQHSPYQPEQTDVPSAT